MPSAFNSEFQSLNSKQLKPLLWRLLTLVKTQAVSLPVFSQCFYAVKPPDIWTSFAEQKYLIADLH